MLYQATYFVVSAVMTIWWMIVMQTICRQNLSSVFSGARTYLHYNNEKVKMTNIH